MIVVYFGIILNLKLKYTDENLMSILQFNQMIRCKFLNKIKLQHSKNRFSRYLNYKVKKIFIRNYCFKVFVVVLKYFF